MTVVLAGTIEFSATEIAIILGLLLLMAVGHIMVLAEYLMQPFVVRTRDRSWPLAFIPVYGPHRLVSAFGLGNGYHIALATAVTICVAGGVLATVTVVSDDLPSFLVDGVASVAALLAWYGIRAVMAWELLGRPPQRMGWRWILTPVGFLVAPILYIQLLRRPLPGLLPPAMTAGRSSPGQHLTAAGGHRLPRPPLAVSSAAHRSPTAAAA